MSVIKFNRNFSTLFSWDTDENPTTEQDYQNAVKNWTETEMNIVDTLLWQPTTEYATGNIVKTPSLPSQYVLRCAEAGTSGSTEPDYSGASVGDTVTDGSVEWVIVSLATGNAADVDAGNIGVNAEVDNSEAWGNAIGGGAVAEDDVRLVTGDTVHAVTSVMETNIATNTEAIEENAENIATNTGNIAQNTTDIDIAEKRIGNIEKLLQGNLYDYQTDTDSKYTKTVLAGAMPYASLEQIGGRTVVWNQICESSMYRTNGGKASGITITHTDTGFTLTGTTTGTSNTWEIRTYLPASHKFLLKGTPVQDGIALRIYIDGAYSDTTENAIFTSGADSSNIFNVAIKPSATDIVVNLTWTPQLFDLTLMFGAGNEPSTYEEFQQMFPAVWYAYNPGSLLSARVTEVVSKKADTTTIATYPIPAEIQALEGYGWSAGNVYNYIDYERKVFVQRVASIDLGSLTWTTTGLTSPNVWKTTNALTAVKAPATPYDVPNAISSKYMTDSNLYTGGGDRVSGNITIIFATSGDAKKVYVCDDGNYADATAFKNAMDGVMLYYELATPVEVDISAYLTDDNLIEVEAGGSLTFPNSNGTDYQIPVPSAETYMVDLQEAI